MIGGRTATDKLDDPVNPLEPLLLDHIRLEVVVQMAVIDRDSDQVESEGSKVFRVCFGVDYCQCEPADFSLQYS